MQVPIAIPTTDGRSVMQQLTTPNVCGTGAELPGLLGLRTLESERAVLDIPNRILYLCTPGTTTITVPPGSLAVPLERAPSGHLVMVVDDYQNLNTVSGNSAHVVEQRSAASAAVSQQARHELSGTPSSHL